MIDIIDGFFQYNHESLKKMSNSKKLSISKIKGLLSLFKFISWQKSKDKATALSFLDQSSINDILESIYNILYDEKLNVNVSKSQKYKLKKLSNRMLIIWRYIKTENPY